METNHPPGRIPLRPVLVVEGKYDKIRLLSLVDARIIPTDGFGIFKNPEKLALIRTAAANRGVVILMDSDAAGFKIRSYLSGCLPRSQVRHAYIPDVYGRERRKAAPSKEGKLGVEGMGAAELLDALRRCGALDEEWSPPDAPAVTALDFYRLGLSGGSDSARKRSLLKARLGLPERLSAKGMQELLGVLMTYDDFIRAVEGLEEESGG